MWSSLSTLTNFTSGLWSFSTAKPSLLSELILIIILSADVSCLPRVTFFANSNVSVPKVPVVDTSELAVSANAFGSVFVMLALTTPYLSIDTVTAAPDKVLIFNVSFGFKIISPDESRVSVTVVLPDVLS